MAINLTPRQRAQYDELSMSEKIAILLIQLGDEITSDIFRHLDIDSITEISKQIAQLGNTDKSIGAFCAFMVAHPPRKGKENYENPRRFYLRPLLYRQSEPGQH